MKDKYIKNWSRDYNMLLMYSVVHAVLIEMERHLGFGVNGALMEGYKKKDSFWTLESGLKQVNKDLIDKLLSSESKFNRFLKLYQRAKKEFKEQAQKIKKAKIESLNNSSLAKFYSGFEKKNLAFMAIGQYTVFQLNEIAPDYLQKKLKESKISDDEIDRILPVVLSPFETKIISQIDKDLLELAYKIKAKKIKDIKPQLDKIVEKYQWIPIMIPQLDPWDHSFFKSRIGEFGSLKNIKEEFSTIKKMESEEKKRKKQFERLLVQYSEHKNLFKAVNHLSYLKDQRDEVRRSCYFLAKPLYQEMAKRIKISIERLGLFTTEEIIIALQSKKLPKDSELNNRKKGYVILKKNNKVILYSGTKANNFSKKYLKEEIDSEVNEFKGTIGSKGIVQGRVKIVKDRNFLDKVEKGDILVSVTTHPEYVPAMKKAKAIITDEGGLTCHAAIVSRELKIPCIVGTKIATKVLRDGDRVEVDANKGIVRKIS